MGISQMGYVLGFPIMDRKYLEQRMCDNLPDMLVPDY